MKKWLILLVGLLPVIGCSSDGDDKEILPTGDYVARSGSVVLCLYLTDGKCQTITAFVDSRVVSQCPANTTGKYPNYTYSGDTFSLACSFDGLASVSVNLMGKLPTLYTNDYVDVSGDYQFARFSGTLDANGDGIIDI